MSEHTMTEPGVIEHDGMGGRYAVVLITSPTTYTKLFVTENDDDLTKFVQSYLVENDVDDDDIFTLDSLGPRESEVDASVAQDWAWRQSWADMLAGTDGQP